MADAAGCPVLHRKGQPVAVGAVLFHDLRRSFAKDAVDAGNDYKTVMDLGGWKTVATFHRYKIVDNAPDGESAQPARGRAEGARLDEGDPAQVGGRGAFGLRNSEKTLRVFDGGDAALTTGSEMRRLHHCGAGPNA